MKHETKRMFCVEVANRYPGDTLGTAIVVLAADVVDAALKAKSLYPEFMEPSTTGGRVFEVAHVLCDWDCGRTLVIKRPVFIQIEPLRQCDSAVESRGNAKEDYRLLRRERRRNGSGSKS